MHFLGSAKEVLDVMAHLVRNDVSLGEVSWGTKPYLEFLEKAQIQIDFAVDGAIEHERVR